MKTLIIPSETSAYLQFAAIVNETDTHYVCLDSFYKFNCVKQYTYELEPAACAEFVECYPSLAPSHQLIMVQHAHRSDALQGYVPQAPAHIKPIK
jgi:hypothetical protein